MVMTKLSERLLILSAHPDDSSIGPPATVALMQREGWDIVDFCCSLGGTDPADQQRRLDEITEASRRASIRLELADPIAALNSKSHPERYEANLTQQIQQKILRLQPSIVVAPHPHELHPGHEVVARAVLHAMSAIDTPPILWCWNIWGDLPFPSLYTPFGQEILDRLQYILEAYEGELDRMPYWDMVRGRAILNRVLGSEKTFHFGAALISDESYAETLLELVRQGDKWLRGTPRVLNPAEPFVEPSDDDLSWWLATPSPQSTFEQHRK